MRRDKDTNGRTEHIFKILPPLCDLLRQIIPAGEFPLAIPLVMMISMEHRLIATGGNHRCGAIQQALDSCGMDEWTTGHEISLELLYWFLLDKTE